MILTDIKKYKHFGDCLFATNGLVEIAVPLSFGIRVIRYAFLDGENIFFEQPEDMTELSTGEGWKIRGGHRMWLSPESEDCYYPDNHPISLEVCGNVICIKQEPDPYLRVNKELNIRFGDDAEIELEHKITNISASKLERSIWAISAMAAGGKGGFGYEETEMIYKPRQKIAFWEFTDPSDKRVHLKKDCCDFFHAKGEGDLKIGFENTCRSYDYINKGIIFEKRTDDDPGGVYPDGGMRFELFMCDHMLEMETLSPIYRLEHGETASHKEYWNLKKVKEKL